MKLLNITVNGIEHWAISDPVANDILDFGAGDTAKLAATEFMNTVLLAEHAAECAGYCL